VLHQWHSLIDGRPHEESTKASLGHPPTESGRAGAVRRRIRAVNIPWLTILTSAAVGVLASSMVTLVGQYFERRSRRNELLLTKALEMAIRRTDVLLEAIKISGKGSAHLPDEVINAETYFRRLKSLLVSGKLPADAEKYK
jgi:hypothetical protein